MNENEEAADALRALLEDMSTWTDISAEEWGDLIEAAERARHAGPIPADCLWFIAQRGWEAVLEPLDD